MNKTVIVFCKMFDMASQITFVEDNEVKRTLISTIDKLNDVVFSLLQEEGCHTVNFKGAKLYSKGVAKKLKDYQMTHYSNYDLTINII